MVFKKGAIQSAAGAMVFSPSYKIKSAKLSADKLTIDAVIEEDMGEIKNDSPHVVWISDSQKNLKGKVVSFDAETNKVEGGYGVRIILNSTIDQFASASGFLVDLGQENSQVVMGINSGETDVYEILKPKGLTIYGPNGDNANSELKVFLGDLTSVGKTGYGLYANNVYLNGSLTTESKTGKIAGVNTVS
jgi:hypothetical protein